MINDSTCFKKFYNFFDYGLLIIVTKPSNSALTFNGSKYVSTKPILVSIIDYLSAIQNY